MGRQTAQCYRLSEYYPSFLNDPEMQKVLNGFFYIVGFGTESISRSPKQSWKMAAEILHKRMLRQLES